MEAWDTTSRGPGAGARLLGRLGLAVLWVVGIVLLVAALAVAGLAALVAHGPVEIAAAARTAETVLREIAGPGGRSSVGSARLEWSWDEGLVVRLREIAVDRAGVVDMRIPEAEVVLRLEPLLTGGVRPRSLILISPEVAVDTVGLAAAGGLAASAPTPGTASATNGAPASSTVARPSEPGAAAAVTDAPAAAAPALFAAAGEIEAAVDRLVRQARREGIERLGVRDGRLDVVRPAVQDAASRTVSVPAIDAEAVVDGPGGELDAGFSARGEVGRWSMRLTSRRDADGRRRLAFDADDVTRRDLFGPAGPAFEFGMPLYPHLTLDFGSEGRLEAAALDVRLGAGEFRFGPMPEDSMLIDEGQVQIGWSPAARRFDVRNLYVAVGETTMTLHGQIAPDAAGDGTWKVRLEADGGGFRPRDVPGKPLLVEGGRLDGRLDPATRTFTVAAAELRWHKASMKAAGTLDVSGPEPRLKLDLAFSPLDADQLKKIWPHWVAPEPRDWVIGKVEAGTLADAEIHLDMPRFDHPETWPGDAFRMSGRLEGVRFRPFGNLPAVAGGDGQLTIADRKLTVTIDRAQAATKAAKRPTIDGMRFGVPDIHAKPSRGSFRFHLAGDVAAVAEVANAEPLALLDEAGIKADGLTGTASVVAQVDLTFEEPLRMSSVDYRVEATLDRFSSPHPIQGRKFQDGRFKVLADPRGLKVTGRAQIDGVAADVDLYEARGGSKAADKRDFKMMLDEAARQRIGLDLGDLVRGAIGVAVTQTSPDDPRRKVEVDLTPARLSLSYFGWSKGAGVPAKATLDLVEDDKGVRLDNLVVETEGLSIAGSVTLDRDRRLVAADFSRFALRKGDAAKFKVARGGDGLQVTFEAQSFDLRSLMQANRKPVEEEARPAAGTAKTDLVLKLRAAKLIGFNDMVLDDVGVDARYRDGAFSTLQFSARSSGGRSVSAAIRPDGARRRLTVTGEDAGALLSFVDAFDRVSGGRIRLDARLGAAGVAQGRLRIDDFHLLEQPKSGRASPLKGENGLQQIQVRRAEFNPQTDFSRSSIVFSMRGGVVTVTEAVAKGATVGATASGQVDLNNQRISLTGTYIPAFGLNNLAGRIPVVGAITGAGSNEGLLGVTFRVFGGLDDPILEINPLSAIAPGIFRRIFEFQKGEADTPPPASNAPTRITP